MSFDREPFYVPQLFSRYVMQVRICRIYTKEDWPYCVILCKVKKKDDEKLNK